MARVSGVLFRDDKPASHFSAQRAEADRATGILKLAGTVHVVAEGEGSELRCETLEWRGAERLIVARGNVRVESPDWTMGPEPEIWANADLTRVGTPSAFRGGKL